MGGGTTERRNTEVQCYGRAARGSNSTFAHAHHTTPLISTPISDQSAISAGTVKAAT